MREIAFVFISKTSFFFVITRSAWKVRSHICFVLHVARREICRNSANGGVIHQPALTDVAWQKKHKAVNLLLLCGTTRPWHQRSLQLLVCPRVMHSCSWIAFSLLWRLSCAEMALESPVKVKPTWIFSWHVVHFLLLFFWPATSSFSGSLGGLKVCDNVFSSSRRNVN